MSPRRPAEFPPGPWPAEMRASRVAAFFDYPSSDDLLAAVRRGEAPRPTALRYGRGGKREPVWAKSLCEDWIARRHQIEQSDGDGPDDLASLI